MSEPIDFHAHVYFPAGNALAKTHALSLRPRLLALGIDGLTLGEINEGPRGPHMHPSYEIFIPAQAFGQVVPWLAFAHENLDVLVHPLTPDEVGDHTTRALWIGEKQPLQLGALAPR